MGPQNSNTRKKRKAILFLFCASLMGVFCFSVGITVYLVRSWQDDAYYKSLAGSFEPEETYPRDPELEDEEDIDDVESDLKIRPTVVDFESKRLEAPEIEAWIKLEGTKINYPVMYRSDNDYYMTRLPNGKPSSGGSIFIDCRNSPDFSDLNTLVYGHRMKSGAMFGMLKYYVNQSYYDEHPTISIFTPGGDYELALFAGYTFDQSRETPPIAFEDEEDFNKFVRTAQRRSMFKSGVEVNYGDRLVTLCTCEYSFKDGRLIIVGKLIEKDG